MDRNDKILDWCFVAALQKIASAFSCSILQTCCRLVMNRSCAIIPDNPCQMSMLEILLLWRSKFYGIVLQVDVCGFPLQMVFFQSLVWHKNIFLIFCSCILQVNIPISYQEMQGHFAIHYLFMTFFSENKFIFRPRLFVGK
jgi:hypothetical protein